MSLVMARMEFGDWLRVERRSRGLTQREVEEAAEISHSHYSKMENGGIKLPAPETRKRIHEVFGTSDDDLVAAGILELRTFRSIDGQRETTLYVPPAEEDRRDETAREALQRLERLVADDAPGTAAGAMEGLPAHLRTSFLKLQGLDEERRKIVERLIDDLDTAAEVERERLRRDESS